MDRFLAAMAMASLIIAICVAAAAPQHKPTFNDRFGDWRRSADIEDRRDDVGLKGDLETAGLAIYHRNH